MIVLLYFALVWIVVAAVILAVIILHMDRINQDGLTGLTWKGYLTLAGLSMAWPSLGIAYLTGTEVEIELEVVDEPTEE